MFVLKAHNKVVSKEVQQGMKHGKRGGVLDDISVELLGNLSFNTRTEGPKTRVCTCSDTAVWAVLEHFCSM